MNDLDDPGLEQIESLIESNGYVKLARPLTIGEISMNIENAWTGPQGSLDLAVIYPRPESRAEGSQLYWELQRVVRALDSAESNRTVTVVLYSASTSLSLEMRHLETELQMVARVLVVDPLVPVSRSLAPLLRLELPAVEERTLDGVALVEATIGVGKRSRDLRALLIAAKDGSRAVESRYLGWVEAAFDSRSETR